MWVRHTAVRRKNEDVHKLFLGWGSAMSAYNNLSNAIYSIIRALVDDSASTGMAGDPLGEGSLLTRFDDLFDDFYRSLGVARCCSSSATEHDAWADELGRRLAQLSLALPARVEDTKDPSKFGSCMSCSNGMQYAWNHYAPNMVETKWGAVPEFWGPIPNEEVEKQHSVSDILPDGRFAVRTCIRCDGSAVCQNEEE